MCGVSVCRRGVQMDLSVEGTWMGERMAKALEQRWVAYKVLAHANEASETLTDRYADRPLLLTLFRLEAGARRPPAHVDDLVLPPCTCTSSFRRCVCDCGI